MKSSNKFNFILVGVTILIAPILSWILEFMFSNSEWIASLCFQEIFEELLSQLILTIPLCLICLFVNNYLFKKTGDPFLAKQHIFISTLLIFILPWGFILYLSRDSNLIYTILSYGLVISFLIWRVKFQVEEFRKINIGVLDDDF